MRGNAGVAEVTLLADFGPAMVPRSSSSLRWPSCSAVTRAARLASTPTSAALAAVMEQAAKASAAPRSNRV
jgi:hypothetical protein